MIDKSPGQVNPGGLRELAHALVAQHRQRQEKLTPPRVAVSLLLSEHGIDPVSAVGLARAIDAVYQRHGDDLAALEPVTARARGFSPEMKRELGMRAIPETESLRDGFLRASRPNLGCDTPGCLRYAHVDGEHVFEQLQPGELDARD